jgi:hypothetical protein
MAKDVLHVVPRDQAWAVRREGSDRVSSTHPTQKEAIDAARELAKEQDDIVIHRADGTIRERVTYSGTDTSTAADPRPVAAAPRVRDLFSVGSRVSWGAVLAGTIIGLATCVALSLLALAVGLSAGHRGLGREFDLGAAVTAGVILAIGLFVGGFAASRATAGEGRGEGASYGVLVWAAALVLALGAGLWPAHWGALRQSGPPSDAARAERVKRELGLDEQQARGYEAVLRESGEAARPEAAAWWSFAGMAVSLLAAIAGGWAGAGRRAVAREARGDRAAVAAPRPA